MSYILDALKKAESERTLGTVPNLHAQPVSTAPPAAIWNRPWIWSVAALLLIALAMLVWLKPWMPTAPPLPAQSMPKIVTPAPPLVISSPAALPSEPIKPKAERKPEIKSLPNQLATPASPLATESRVGTLRELPEHLQREIPAVTIGGYIYSSKPADRSVLINNRLLREGEQIGPGLTLEKMLPKEAILNYMGHRYRLSY